ncbi:hypothetical protein AB4Z40_28170 [Bosea sp. 2YAB26]|uniref:hypothetical protein n=1 Tax=Bosea sp. 2YAB26 TaxID=3237478 RepID=UPI003F925A94
MARSVLITIAVAFAGAALSAEPQPSKALPPASATAACLEQNSLPNDVFGFNSGSDVNDLGQFSLSGAYGGSFGARSGPLASHNLNVQATYSPWRCVELDPFAFAGVTNSKTFGAKANGSTVGGGIEMKYKLLGRDTNGVGLTFDAVLQGAATDGAFYTLTGRSRSVYDGVFSVFLDKELVAGKLYGALNVSYDWNYQDLGSPSGGYARTSIARIGGALTYQLADSFFIGAEASHFRRYDNLAFGHVLGQATFAGPNFYWAFTKDWALSGAWSIQVAGRATGVGGNVDLTNFSHHIAKLKLNHDF